MIPRGGETYPNIVETPINLHGHLVEIQYLVKHFQNTLRLLHYFITLLNETKKNHNLLSNRSNLERSSKPIHYLFFAIHYLPKASKGLTHRALINEYGEHNKQKFISLSFEEETIMHPA